MYFGSFIRPLESPSSFSDMPPRLDGKGEYRPGAAGAPGGGGGGGGGAGTRRPREAIDLTDSRRVDLTGSDRPALPRRLRVVDLTERPAPRLPPVTIDLTELESPTPLKRHRPAHEIYRQSVGGFTAPPPASSPSISSSSSSSSSVSSSPSLASLSLLATRPLSSSPAPAVLQVLANLDALLLGTGVPSAPTSGSMGLGGELKYKDIDNEEANYPGIMQALEESARMAHVAAITTVPATSVPAPEWMPPIAELAVPELQPQSSQPPLLEAPPRLSQWTEIGLIPVAPVGGTGPGLVPPLSESFGAQPVMPIFSASSSSTSSSIASSGDTKPTTAATPAAIIPVGFHLLLSGLSERVIPVPVEPRELSTMTGLKFLRTGEIELPLDEKQLTIPVEEFAEALGDDGGDKGITGPDRAFLKSTNLIEPERPGWAMAVVKKWPLERFFTEAGQSMRQYNKDGTVSSLLRISPFECTKGPVAGLFTWSIQVVVTDISAIDNKVSLDDHRAKRLHLVAWNFSIKRVLIEYTMLVLRQWSKERIPETRRADATTAATTAIAAGPIRAPSDILREVERAIRYSESLNLDDWNRIRRIASQNFAWQRATKRTFNPLTCLDARVYFHLGLGEIESPPVALTSKLDHKYAKRLRGERQYEQSYLEGCVIVADGSMRSSRHWEPAFQQAVWVLGSEYGRLLDAILPTSPASSSSSSSLHSAVSPTCDMRALVTDLQGCVADFVSAAKFGLSLIPAARQRQTESKEEKNPQDSKEDRGGAQSMDERSDGDDDDDDDSSRDRLRPHVYAILMVYRAWSLKRWKVATEKKREGPDADTILVPSITEGKSLPFKDDAVSQQIHLRVLGECELIARFLDPAKWDSTAPVIEGIATKMFPGTDLIDNKTDSLYGMPWTDRPDPYTALVWLTIVTYIAHTNNTDMLVIPDQIYQGVAATAQATEKVYDTFYSTTAGLSCWTVWARCGPSQIFQTLAKLKWVKRDSDDGDGDVQVPVITVDIDANLNRAYQTIQVTAAIVADMYKGQTIVWPPNITIHSRAFVQLAMLMIYRALLDRSNAITESTDETATRGWHTLAAPDHRDARAARALMTQLHHVLGSIKIKRTLKDGSKVPLTAEYLAAVENQQELIGKELHAVLAGCISTVTSRTASNAKLNSATFEEHIKVHARDHVGYCWELVVALCKSVRANIDRDDNERPRYQNVYEQFKSLLPEDDPFGEEAVARRQMARKNEEVKVKKEKKQRWEDEEEEKKQKKKKVIESDPRAGNFEQYSGLVFGQDYKCPILLTAQYNAARSELVYDRFVGWMTDSYHTNSPVRIAAAPKSLTEKVAGYGKVCKWAPIKTIDEYDEYCRSGPLAVNGLFDVSRVLGVQIGDTLVFSDMLVTAIRVLTEKMKRLPERMLDDIRNTYHPKESDTGWVFPFLNILEADTTDPAKFAEALMRQIIKTFRHPDHLRNNKAVARAMARARARVAASTAPPTTTAAAATTPKPAPGPAKTVLIPAAVSIPAPVATIPKKRSGEGKQELGTKDSDDSDSAVPAGPIPKHRKRGGGDGVESKGVSVDEMDEEEDEDEEDETNKKAKRIRTKNPPLTLEQKEKKEKEKADRMEMKEKEKKHKADRKERKEKERKEEKEIKVKEKESKKTQREKERAERREKKKREKKERREEEKKKKTKAAAAAGPPLRKVGSIYLDLPVELWHAVIAVVRVSIVRTRARREAVKASAEATRMRVMQHLYKVSTSSAEVKHGGAGDWLVMLQDSDVSRTYKSMARLLDSLRGAVENSELKTIQGYVQFLRMPDGHELFDKYKADILSTCREVRLQFERSRRACVFEAKAQRDGMIEIRRIANENSDPKWIPIAQADEWSSSPTLLRDLHRLLYKYKDVPGHPQGTPGADWADVTLANFKVRTYDAKSRNLTEDERVLLLELTTTEGMRTTGTGAIPDGAIRISNPGSGARLPLTPWVELLLARHSMMRRRGISMSQLGVLSGALRTTVEWETLEDTLSDRIVFLGGSSRTTEGGAEGKAEEKSDGKRGGAVTAASSTVVFSDALKIRLTTSKDEYERATAPLEQKQNEDMGTESVRRKLLEIKPQRRAHRAYFDVRDWFYANSPTGLRGGYFKIMLNSSATYEQYQQISSFAPFWEFTSEGKLETEAATERLRSTRLDPEERKAYQAVINGDLLLTKLVGALNTVTSQLRGPLMSTMTGTSTPDGATRQSYGRDLINPNGSIAGMFLLSYESLYGECNVSMTRPRRDSDGETTSHGFDMREILKGDPGFERQLEVIITSDPKYGDGPIGLATLIRCSLMAQIWHVCLELRIILKRTAEFFHRDCKDAMETVILVSMVLQAMTNTGASAGVFSHRKQQQLLDLAHATSAHLLHLLQPAVVWYLSRIARGGEHPTSITHEETAAFMVGNTGLLLDSLKITQDGLTYGAMFKQLAFDIDSTVGDRVTARVAANYLMPGVSASPAVIKNLSEIAMTYAVRAWGLPTGSSGDSDPAAAALRGQMRDWSGRKARIIHRLLECADALHERLDPMIADSERTIADLDLRLERRRKEVLYPMLAEWWNHSNLWETSQLANAFGDAVTMVAQDADYEFRFDILAPWLIARQARADQSTLGFERNGHLRGALDALASIYNFTVAPAGSGRADSNSSSSVSPAPNWLGDKSPIDELHAKIMKRAGKQSLFRQHSISAQRYAIRWIQSPTSASGDAVPHESEISGPSFALFRYSLFSAEVTDPYIGGRWIEAPGALGAEYDVKFGGGRVMSGVRVITKRSTATKSDWMNPRISWDPPLDSILDLAERKEAAATREAAASNSGAHGYEMKPIDDYTEFCRDVILRHLTMFMLKDMDIDLSGVTTSLKVARDNLRAVVATAIALTTEDPQSIAVTATAAANQLLTLISNEATTASITGNGRDRRVVQMLTRCSDALTTIVNLDPGSLANTEAPVESKVLALTDEIHAIRLWLIGEVFAPWSLGPIPPANGVYDITEEKKKPPPRSRRVIEDLAVALAADMAPVLPPPPSPPLPAGDASSNSSAASMPESGDASEEEEGNEEEEEEEEEEEDGSVSVTEDDGEGDDMEGDDEGDGEGDEEEKGDGVIRVYRVSGNDGEEADGTVSVYDYRQAAVEEEEEEEEDDDGDEKKEDAKESKDQPEIVE